MEQGEKKPVVLMVDDTPANLGVLFELLSEAGFRVLVAEDGESALSRADYAHPDLILLDVLMPGMDGFTVCERLKEQASTASIPVIFMTALTDTVDKVKGFELGAVDYITKPFQDQEVLARVRTHLTIQQLKNELRDSQEQLSGIFDSAMDAIISLDEERRITLLNRAAEEMFRCHSQAVSNRPVSDLFTPDSAKTILRFLDQLDNKQNERKALWLTDGLEAHRINAMDAMDAANATDNPGDNNEAIPIEASLARADSGGIIFYTLVLRDVSQRFRAEAERTRLQGMALYLNEEVRASTAGDDLVGESPALREVMASVKQVADTDATVLVTGETGTGKEVIARAIHDMSHLRDNILVKLNCAAIPAGLVESELFGHEKGAFTGAVNRKIGRFELADGGTIFLDEIGELPLDLQAKLLRVLQEGEFERVGGSQTFKVNVRVIAATNRDLEKCSQEGEFRADLYYRLNVFPIHLPPLRERPEDIVPLVRHFVQQFAGKFSRDITLIPERLMTVLLNYDWPGNIRELQHVIERAVILSKGNELELGDWFRSGSSATVTGSSRVLTLAEVERNHILDVLELTGWRVSGKKGAAELLGLKPTTLESRMKKLNIVRKRKSAF